LRRHHACVASACDDVEALRDLTRRFFATHPVTAPPLDRLRPYPTPKASGETERRDPAALAAVADPPPLAPSIFWHS